MHKHLIVVASVLILAATSAPAWARWGCGAKGPGERWSDSWDSSSQARASALALKTCGKGCRIIGCRADVNTADEADALWRQAGDRVTNCTANDRDPATGRCR